MAAQRDLRCGFLANHHSLVKKLDTDALLPDLISHGLITPDEKELISHETTGSQKTDRFLTSLHRRGTVDSSVYQKLLDLLSDESVAAGQFLSEVVKQIKADSSDENVKARFTNSDLREGDGDWNDEDNVVKSLSVKEVLPQLVSYGVVTWNENDRIRSKSNEEDKARELYRIIRQRGPAAYDKFVEVLLESETTASLGEILKNKCKINNDKYAARPPEAYSKEFQRLLEESVSDIAAKFYNLGLQEGIQRGIQAGIKAVGDSAGVAGVAAGPPPPPDESDLKSLQIAERLKQIVDELPKDILEETRMTFLKLFTTESSFTVSRQRVRSICAKILVKYHHLFPSGWHQISFVYYAMLQVTLAVVKEAGKASSAAETRQQQVANFVYPALAELGLVEWMEKHGGMEKLGSPVKGEGATVVINIEESPED